MSGTAERLGVPLDSPLLSRQRLSKAERADIKRVVDKQLDYLKGFEQARGDMSEQAVLARSQMYVGALRPTYYGARWGDYEIPERLMPGNQTCLTNCKCEISITDNDDGTGTLTRTLGSEKSCDECPGLAGDHAVKRREEGSTKSQSAQDRAIFASLDEKGSRRTPKAGGNSHGGGGSDATPVKSRTPAETHSVLMEHNQVKRLTTNQEQSLHYYQSQGHETVNRVLRGEAATERQRNDAERTVKNIDQVMQRSRVTENVEVHRGMVVTDPAAHAALSRMQPGAVLREDGYMSTSADPEVIKRFGGGSGWDNPYPGDTPVTMRVRVRAGTRAAYMPATRRHSQANSEKELLIDRGATYQVTDRRESNGRVEIDVDVLGHDN